MENSLPDPQTLATEADADADADAGAGAGAEKAPGSNSAWAPGEANIVIVDDEPLNSGALAVVLHGAGYTRVASQSGCEATTQALRDEQPDLVVLELALHQTDAFELLRAMRADRVLGHVPVIVLTAQDSLANRLRALDIGATDYLVRPLDGTELVLRVRNTLAAKAHRDQLAFTDRLTGLPSRDVLLWRLDWALKHARRHRTGGAVLQIGLDRFSQVNDALGPALGDELLHAVSQRLVSALRDSDTVVQNHTPRAPVLLSRGGGDEFAVLLPVVERAEDAAAVAKRLIERIAEPITVAGHELLVTCRVGVAVFPGDSDDKDTVLQQAGVAMRHARDAGQTAGGYQFYSEELNALSLHRLKLERELHHALERNEFRLHYQAQVDVASGRLCGAEALVRWQHPTRGLLGPGEFIGLAEESALIVRIGDWVLREAMRQLAQWRRGGLASLQMSVNASSLQLQRVGLADDVREALSSAGVEGPDLCLELTESAIIESGPQVAETLQAIKQLGVRLSLDDFGTGYSSLTSLRRFPIDELKIDRSFVSECDSDGSNAEITAAIIAMAHRLGLRVVAEGVETPQQLAFIRTQGADVFQGYLFARPLPADEFTALLASSRPASRLAETAVDASMTPA